VRPAVRHELVRLVRICDTEATLPDGSNADTLGAHALLDSEPEYLRCLDVGYLAVTLETDEAQEVPGAPFVVRVRYLAGGSAAVAYCADRAHGIAAWVREINCLLAGGGLSVPSTDDDGNVWIEGGAS
jgi:hypothetical protein